MSTLKVNNLQVGQDGTAANNYTLYQPASPDGTVRLGYGNAGSVTDILTLKNSRLGIGTNDPQGQLAVVLNNNGLEFNPGSGQAIVSYNRATSAFKPVGMQGSTVGLYIGGVGEVLHINSAGLVGIGTNNPVGNLEIRDSKANLIVAKDGLTVKSNSDLATQYDLIQLGAGGGLASYSTATATADTQFLHNAYRHSGGNWKYRYADTAARLRVNSPGRTWIFESAASGSADADISFSEQLRITSDSTIHGGVSNPAGYNLVTGGPNYHSLLVGSTNGGTAALVLDGAANGDGSGSDYGSIEHFSDGTLRYKNRQSSGSGGSGHIFYTTNSDTERFRINSDGNVSIGGRSNPLWNSTVDALTVGYAGVLYEDSYSAGGVAGNDNYLILGNNIYYAGSGGNRYIRTDEASRIMMQAGTFYFQSAGSGTAGNAITFTDRLRITNTGRIGINVTSPEDPLHVKNSSNAAGSIRVQTGKSSTSNGDEYASIIFDGSSYTGAKIASHRDDGAWDDRGDLRFYSGYGNNVFTERYRITNTGMVRHSGGHTNQSGNLAASAYYRIVASSTVPANSNVTFVISGLASGWMTIRGGGYSNAGQSQYSLMYQLGGYMTATSTYDAHEVRIWANGAGISTQKNASDFRITITNNSGSYGLNTTWCIESSNGGIKIRT